MNMTNEMTGNKASSLDSELIKKISHANHTAVVTATALALRQRNRPFTDITRTKVNLIRGNEKIVEADYLLFWKDLLDAGIGSIIFGRRGKPDRFEWHYSLKSVGQVAIDRGQLQAVSTEKE